MYKIEELRKKGYDDIFFKITKEVKITDKLDDYDDEEIYNYFINIQIYTYDKNTEEVLIGGLQLIDFTTLYKSTISLLDSFDIEQELSELSELVIEDETEVNKKYENTIYIHSIELKEEFRKLGIGSYIIEQLENILYKSFDIDCFDILVKPFPIEVKDIDSKLFEIEYKKIIKFYKNLGFKKIPKEDYYIKNFKLLKEV